MAARGPERRLREDGMDGRSTLRLDKPAEKLYGLLDPIAKQDVKKEERFAGEPGK